MTYKVSPNTIRTFWEALSRPPTRNHRVSYSLIQRIVEDGWASASDLEDVVFAMDSRLDEIKIHDLAEAFKLPWRSVFYTPNSRSNSVIGSQGLSAADAAELLICIEQLGFNIDPAPLTQLLIGQIKKLKRITNSQLSVLWFERTRHKMGPISLEAASERKAGEVVQKKVSLTGYKVALWTGSDGQPVAIEVNAPKYRRLKKPEETVCPDCEYTYYRGSPDSSAAHRKEHKKRLGYLRPQPHLRFLEARANESDPELVTVLSAAWKHREMYLRAGAFRREFHYDFIQWGDPEDDPDAQGFLFANEAGSILGACAFRRREHDGKSWWGLQWIWICPLARRKGMLTERWLEFRKRFGDFRVEGPVSPAMEHFVVKQGDVALLGYDPFAEDNN